MKPPGSVHVRIKRLSIDPVAAGGAFVDSRFHASLQEALRERLAPGGDIDTKPGRAAARSLAQEVAAAVAARVGARAMPGGGTRHG